MSNGSQILRKLKLFDAYPKTLEDFRVKTFSGAAITLSCIFIVVILFSYEWLAYLSTDLQQELFVDITRNEKMNINMDITFPRIPCELISIDAMDVSGAQQTHVVKGIEKRYLNSEGVDITDLVEKDFEKRRELPDETTTTVVSDTNLAILCGSCYGAETPARNCCNTCNDVRDAYREKRWQFSLFGIEQCKNELEHSGASRVSEDQLDGLLKSGNGCRLQGHLEVNKVGGNFHIAPGYSYEENHMHVHDLKVSQVSLFNSSHIFKGFYFGNERFPNQLNPLDNAVQVETNQACVSYNYYIKIVPTTYEYENGVVLNNSYQYSVTKSQKVVDVLKDPGRMLPGVFFTYELSPIMVKFIERKRSLVHFLTSCCAIIGGVFTVAGLVDAIVYRYYNMYKKLQLNKLT